MVADHQNGEHQGRVIVVADVITTAGRSHCGPWACR
jgi:hypothetical protein